MKTSLVYISSILFVPLMASAQTYYYSGNETPTMSGTSKKHGQIQTAGRGTAVLIEVKVEGDKITKRSLRAKDSSTLEAVGLQINKQGNSWTWTDPKSKRPVPVTVDMSGGRLKKITRSHNVANVTRTLTMDLSDPILFRQEETTVLPGGAKSTMVTDAGIILENQFQAAIKGKKIEPKKFTPPAKK